MSIFGWLKAAALINTYGAPDKVQIAQGNPPYLAATWGDTTIGFDLQAIKALAVAVSSLEKP